MPPREVLTTAQLRVRLGGRRQVQTAVAASAWTRVLRGAYAAGPEPPDIATRCHAACLVLPENAYIADRCLLWLVGIDVLPSAPPGSLPLPLLEVVVPRGAVVPKRWGMRAREAALPPADRASVRGVRCLRLGRAVGDLLRRLPLAEAVVVADAVQHAGKMTSVQLQTELARHVRLRGIRQAHRALELSSPLAESPPESRLRLGVVLGGLTPVPQYDVFAADGRWLARVDLAFPGARVAIEYDGREVHLRADVFVRDRQRQNALLREGWLVLRYTSEDLRLRLPSVIAEIRAALLTAAA